MRLAYLHGFASSPRSSKALAIEARLDAAGLEPLHRPDLNQPDFAHLTFSAALEHLDAVLDHDPARPWLLCGSSMGGYLAARFAELHPERVGKLLLLCPGFGLARRWPGFVGDEAMATWERTGRWEVPDFSGQLVGLHWDFLLDARRHPDSPEVPCETVIVHGRRDTIVPIAQSRDYAARRDHVRLIEVDDEHRLLDALDTICAQLAELAGLPLF